MPQWMAGRFLCADGSAPSRDSKNFGFIELNDGSCFKNVQVVLVADQLDCYKEIMRQNVGAALVVKGTVKLTPRPSSPLRLRPRRWRWKGNLLPTTRFRRSATRWNFSGKLPTFA